LAGVAADLVEEESDGVGVSGLGEAVVLGVAALRESALGGRGNTSSYRDFRPTSFGKEAVEELGAGLGVTEGGSDAEDLEFGLRRASATAKESSMSSPMSVSMITFSGMAFSGTAGVGEDCTEQTGEAVRMHKPGCG